MTRIFLDANVLFSAVASASGGSAFILEGCRQGKFQPFVSRLVLLEAERNIRKKLPPAALTRFHRWLEDIPFRVVPPPSEDEIRIHRALINEKDAPVLAAAVASGAQVLLTLDQKDFLAHRNRLSALRIRVLSPREFLQSL
ncbi:MAG: PIN domain-containing protein [Candidatus Omnitrophica bacterium]|nr:PIN domain-containing protein [Candidatus Omnitrophota bacterium]